MFKYNCIGCGSELEYGSEKFTCRNCGKTYDVKDGIKMFNKDTNYYGDLSPEDMRALLEEMETRDWQELAFEKFSKVNPFLYYMVTDANRADWQYSVPLKEDSLVLDVGAGWGTLTFPLSTRAKVIALDGTFERLNFIRKRAKQEKNPNIVDFVNANILDNPFEKEMFDLVVLNGVLEWIGDSVNTGDPRELQLQALKNILSILKPGGYLYIGIENMYGFKYLIGAEDDHTLVPDLCYLDRDKASEYARVRIGRDYRIYTYDKQGYNQLLSEAGYDKVKFYYPYPDYKSIQSFMDLDGRVVGFYNENIAKKRDIKDLDGRVQVLEGIAAKNGTVENYVPSYGIIAQKVK